MEEGVSDKKVTRVKKNDEGKEAECLYDTSPNEMEEAESDINDDKYEKNTREKRLNA